MWWQAKSLRAKASQAASNVAVKFVVAGVAIVFLFGTVAGASACSDSKHEKQKQLALVVDQKMEDLASTTKAASVRKTLVSARSTQPLSVLKRNCSGSCCNVDCHGHGCASDSGCCSTGFASLVSGNPSLFVPISLTCLLPVSQSEAASARPPPDFRPPRNFV